MLHNPKQKIRINIFQLSKTSDVIYYIFLILFTFMPLFAIKSNDLNVLM